MDWISTLPIPIHSDNENLTKMGMDCFGSSFPKSHDFAKATDEELTHAIHLINDRPRKCLGWKSAHESFMEQVSYLD